MVDTIGHTMISTELLPPRYTRTHAAPVAHLHTGGMSACFGCNDAAVLRSRGYISHDPHDEMTRPKTYFVKRQCAS